MDNLPSRHTKFALSNVLNHKGRSNELLKEYINARNYITVPHLILSTGISRYLPKMDPAEQVE